MSARASSIYAGNIQDKGTAGTAVVTTFSLYIFFILRRRGKKKDFAHHTSTYFHTRRVATVARTVTIL